MVTETQPTCSPHIQFWMGHNILSEALTHPVLIPTATRDESLCVIANPAFVVYSSIVSFYVPFIITLLVYVQIYVVLRKRRKRVNTKPKQRACQPADPDVATSLKVSCRSKMSPNAFITSAMKIDLHLNYTLDLNIPFMCCCVFMNLCLSTNFKNFRMNLLFMKKESIIAQPSHT